VKASVQEGEEELDTGTGRREEREVFTVTDQHPHTDNNYTHPLRVQEPCGHVLVSGDCCRDLETCGCCPQGLIRDTDRLSPPELTALTALMTEG